MDLVRVENHNEEVGIKSEQSRGASGVVMNQLRAGEMEARVEVGGGVEDDEVGVGVG